MPVKLPSPEIAVVGAVRCGDAVGNWDPGLGSLRGCCGDRALVHLITQKPLANAKQKANNFLFSPASFSLLVSLFCIAKYERILIYLPKIICICVLRLSACRQEAPCAICNCICVFQEC